MRLVFLATTCIAARLYLLVGPFDFTITYHDGAKVVQSSPTRELCFEPRASHRFTYRACDASGQCQPESAEICAQPLLGDTDCDGAVGSRDFLAVRDGFGRTSP